MARPRSFDSELALRRIRDLFWRRGFDATSLHDIMAATGLNKGSIYAAFGDKRAMYRAALEDYDRSEVEGAVRLLTDGGPRGGIIAIGGLFDQAIAECTGAGQPIGCFLCNASADQAPVDGPAQAIMRASMGRFTAAFAAALARMPRCADDGRARHARAETLMALYVGMRVMARGGAPASALRMIRDTAIADLAD